MKRYIFRGAQDGEKTLGKLSRILILIQNKGKSSSLLIDSCGLLKLKIDTSKPNPAQCLTRLPNVQSRKIGHQEPYDLIYMWDIKLTQ